MKDKVNFIKKCMKRVEKHSKRLGISLYYRIYQNEQYKLLDIDSQEFYDYINYQMFDEEGITINPSIWKEVISLLRGKYGNIKVGDLRNRVAYKNDKIYFDLFDNDKEKMHYVEVTENGWNAVDEDMGYLFKFGEATKPQCIPEKDKGDYKLIEKYLNVQEKDKLLLLVYIVALLVPDIQYPILNIVGEHDTGKTTISKLIKSLADNAEDDQIGLSSDERNLLLPLFHNHVTVFDNIQSLSHKTMELFCRVVTGGKCAIRKLYSNLKEEIVYLRSAIILNGISSVITKPDLMSRTVFIHTVSKSEMKTYYGENKMKADFEEDKPLILAGIFDILSKAMKVKETVNIEENFRMKDFSIWGYAIAESIEFGLGEQFVDLLKRNEETHLIEDYLNEPIIPLICNYMKVRKGEEVDKSTTLFYKELMRNCDLYLGENSEYDRKLLPQNVTNFSKKLNSLRTTFIKFGILIEIDRTHDWRNISRISISMVEDNEDVGVTQETVENPFKNNIKRIPIIINRIPIVGIRKPIKLE